MPNKKQVKSPYQMYLECLLKCKGDLKCEERCGGTWGDIVYKHIHPFRIVKKIDIKNQQ